MSNSIFCNIFLYASNVNMFAYLFMSGSKFAEKKSSLKRENSHFYWMNNPFWLNVLNIFMKTIECQQPFAYWKHLFACSCQWYEERNWKAIPFINFKVEIEIWFAYILRNQHHLRSAARLSPWLTAVLSMYQWYLTNLIFFTNILYADKNLQSLEEIVNQELCKPCDLLTANKLTFEYKEKFCHILSR